jgi:hypothetical protein
LADALPGVSTGCQFNLNARLPHVAVTRITPFAARYATLIRMWSKVERRGKYLRW